MFSHKPVQQYSLCKYFLLVLLSTCLMLYCQAQEEEEEQQDTRTSLVLISYEYPFLWSMEVGGAYCEVNPDMTLDQIKQKTTEDCILIRETDSLTMYNCQWGSLETENDCNEIEGFCVDALNGTMSDAGAGCVNPFEEQDED